MTAEREVVGKPRPSGFELFARFISLIGGYNDEHYRVLVEASKTWTFPRPSHFLVKLRDVVGRVRRIN